jgi:hypothetical protein
MRNLDKTPTVDFGATVAAASGGTPLPNLVPKNLQSSEKKNKLKRMRMIYIVL